ncbi:MAG: FAD binding domain-containing protein [Alphaproteobacteria bacterium]|nr:FAD binding domain-containing protein [Alphaproteobacteria bacterium]
MKAPAFEYVRPQSLAEAVALLAQSSDEARVIAGGQTLLAMMNLRIAAPALLIDIARLPELAATTEDDDNVILGACITHAMIEDGQVPDPSRGLMPHAAAGLAYRAIRNRGTIAGSLALADPAAEWPAVLTALGAATSVCGPQSRRSLDCGQFATGIFETRLGEGEIIESVRIPKLSADARWGYIKLTRKSGEFANALAVAVADYRRGHVRVVLGAANGPPLILAEATRALAETERDPEALHAAAAADLDNATDRHFDDFQRNLHMIAAVRAMQQVIA